ncbi:MAG: hypothetical protein HYW27_00255 [Candidatus Aenigmarchaeota archaeon]|nr:hypothetical protein [Candidatus Aenigmarchaeota archaeon]
MADKIKVYLDTNMILDVFINHAKAVKKKEERLLPKKYGFMLANKDRIEFVTSFITKAEVTRELVSSFGMEYADITPVWSKFISSLDCKYLQRFEFDGTIDEIVGRVKIRLRTMFNFMHIFIAMKENSYFISGDKDIIRKSRETKIYDRIISYIEFRKMIEESKHA